MDNKETFHQWEQVELMSTLSVHDQEWLMSNGTEYATGMYSCGELIDLYDYENRQIEKQ